MKYQMNQDVAKSVVTLGKNLNGNGDFPTGVDEAIVDIESYKPPRMLTIKQTAATGILSETALRTMAKEGRIPGIAVGNRLYINFDRLCTMLNAAVVGCCDE